MSLPRYIPTRLLEAVDLEVKACFAQPALGLESLYKASDESWKVFPYATLEGESVQAYQINIVVMPMEYDQGVGAVNRSMLDVSIFFHFPINIRTFQVGVGANSYLDHVWALRDWLFSGGRWAARIGTELKSAPIEDPDHEGVALAHLIHFGFDVPFKTQTGSALVVPAGAIWETRESSRGEIT